MKHTQDKDVDIKIHSFLSKKAEQYPELLAMWQDEPSVTKPNFPERLIRSLVSHKLMPTN